MPANAPRRRRRPWGDRARDLAAALDVDVAATGICYACLSFVSFPLDSGKEQEATREARKLAPILWDEGLEQPALASVRRAVAAGVPDADLACAALEDKGGRSIWAHAIVLRLAADLTRRTRTAMSLEAAARDRLALAPPELN